MLPLTFAAMVILAICTFMIAAESESNLSSKKFLQGSKPSSILSELASANLTDKPKFSALLLALATVVMILFILSVIAQWVGWH